VRIKTNTLKSKACMKTARNAPYWSNKTWYIQNNFQEILLPSNDFPPAWIQLLQPCFNFSSISCTILKECVLTALAFFSCVAAADSNWRPFSLNFIFSKMKKILLEAISELYRCLKQLEACFSREATGPRAPCVQFVWWRNLLWSRQNLTLFSQFFSCLL
jgi:hypothetical protein